MTTQEMWEQFVARHPAVAADYEAWAYGDAPDALAKLTLDGVKRATSSAAALYPLENEPLPQAGDYSILLDAAGNALCVLRNTRVRVLPFHEVDEHHAFLEGEGDRSLAWWRSVHERFFRQELAQHNLLFTDDIAVVCEEFEVVYQ